MQSSKDVNVVFPFNRFLKFIVVKTKDFKSYAFSREIYFPVIGTCFAMISFLKVSNRKIFSDCNI